MTEPKRNTREPKPKPEVRVNALSAEDAKVRDAVADAVSAVDGGAVVEEAIAAAAADTDEDAQPEVDAPIEEDPAPVRVDLPLLDGKTPEWAAAYSTGPRHVQITARPGIKPRDLASALDTVVIHLPSHADPIRVASAAVTEPRIRPARITFTTSGPVNA